MKTFAVTSSCRRLPGLNAVAALALAGATGSAFAATATWNNFTNSGVGWQAAANWAEAAVPVSSNDLTVEFSSHSANYSSSVNFAGAPFVLNRLVFSEGAGSALTTLTTPNVALAFSSSSAGEAPSIVQNSSGEMLIQGNGGINLASGNLELKGSGSGLVSLRAVISGSNGIDVNGSAQFQLLNVNTYSGGTTVNSGALRLSAASRGVLGTGALRVNGGTVTALQRTGGGGVVFKDTDVLSNATIVSANATATFGGVDEQHNGAVNLSGLFTVEQGATLRVLSKLNLTHATGPVIADNTRFEIGEDAVLSVARLDVSEGLTVEMVLGDTAAIAVTGVLTGATGDLSFVLSGGEPGGVYTLLTFGSTDLDYDNLKLIGNGYVLDTSFGTGGWSLNAGELQVKVLAVPEPSHVALVVAVAAGSLLFVRRKSRAV